MSKVATKATAAKRNSSVRYSESKVKAMLEERDQRYRELHEALQLSEEHVNRLRREVAEIQEVREQQKQWDDLVKIVEEHEDKHSIRYGGSLAERLAYVLRQYHQVALNNLAGVKSFRDDLLVQFRALAIVVDMAGSASTHAEKNARLRGLSEIIESSVEALRKEQFTFNNNYWREPSVFRSDYPTREFLSRIHQLEYEKRELKRQLAKAKGEPLPEEPEDDSNPWHQGN